MGKPAETVAAVPKAGRRDLFGSRGFRFRVSDSGIRVDTLWSTNISSKVNLPLAIRFRAKCGANVVT